MNTDVTSLQERIAELEEIHRLADSLNSIVGVYQTLQAIADCALKLCNADRVAIVLFNPVSQESTHTVVRGRTEKDQIDHRINALLAGWIVTKKQILRTTDVLQELNVKDATGGMLDHGPALAIPLNVRGEPFGALNLINARGRRKFTDADARNAIILGPLAAHFIHTARIRESLFQENVRLRNELDERRATDVIVGESPAIRRTKEAIELVAPTSSTVLLTGETGTGKELAARAIHARSPRASKLFVAVNCSAIPEGLIESELFGHERGAFTGAGADRQGRFELAHEGTLFLDEISSMPLESQPKLLRVLETKSFSRVGSSVELHVDVRLIAASNIDLEGAAHQGRFRMDLYHRLSVVPIRLPSLRDRREDIPLLAQSFLEQFSMQKKRFSDDALSLLAGLDWPGNVRELRNIVERVSILSSSAEIDAEQLKTLGIGSQHDSPSSLSSVLLSLIRLNTHGQDLLEQIEKMLVETALHESGGSVVGTAKLLGIDRNAVQRRLEKFGLIKK